MTQPMQPKRNNPRGYRLWALALAALAAAPAMAQRPLLPPDASPPAAAPVPAPATDEKGLPTISIGEQPLPASENKEVVDPTQIQVPSLFFTQKEMARIHAAVESYRQSAAARRVIEPPKPETPATPDTTLQQQQQNNLAPPQFFLASLVYHSAKDWVIYINQQKITSQTPLEMPEIRVESIDRDKVVLVWKPVNVIWLNIPDPDPDNSVVIDKPNGTVTFTLHANQTFLVATMQVIEGKDRVGAVPNIPPEVTPMAPPKSTLLPTNKPAAVALTPVTGPTTQPPATEGKSGEENEGLSGLMNNYKKVGAVP